MILLKHNTWFSTSFRVKNRDLYWTICKLHAILLHVISQTSYPTILPLAILFTPATLTSWISRTYQTHFCSREKFCSRVLMVPSSQSALLKPKKVWGLYLKFYPSSYQTVSSILCAPPRVTSCVTIGHQVRCLDPPISRMVITIAVQTKGWTMRFPWPEVKMVEYLSISYGSTLYLPHEDLIRIRQNE